MSHSQGLGHGQGDKCSPRGPSGPSGNPLARPPGERIFSSLRADPLETSRDLELHRSGPTRRGGSPPKALSEETSYATLTSARLDLGETDGLTSRLGLSLVLGKSLPAARRVAGRRDFGMGSPSAAPPRNPPDEEMDAFSQSPVSTTRRIVKRRHRPNGRGLGSIEERRGGSTGWRYWWARSLVTVKLPEISCRNLHR